MDTDEHEEKNKTDPQFGKCPYSQKMKSIIALLNKLRFVLFAVEIFLLIAIFISLYFLGKNLFRSTPESVTSTPVEFKINFQCTGNTDIDTKDIKSFSESETLVKKVAESSYYLASKEVQRDYDICFSKLLSLLTVLGIAVPTLLALIQFKFSEKELQKIDLAQADAKDSVNSANDAQEKANQSIEAVEQIQREMEENLKKLNSQMATTYSGFAQMAYDMGCEVVERLKCYPGDGDEVRWEEETDLSPADFYFLQSINYHLLESEVDINRLQTLAITMTIDRITDKRSADQFDTLESCIINAERIYDTTQNTDVKRILEKLKEKEKSRKGKITVSPSTKDGIKEDEPPSNEGKKTDQGEQPKI